ncbi:MAG TPA: hypothetical protein VFX95_00320 [Caulobacteraceae bacterium]|nr:hypothetical protein [Caulobacteraceae bacterium]
MFIVGKSDTVVRYRTLAQRWDERAARAPNEGGRERCSQLAEAYRSLVSVLANDDARPHDQAG